MTQSAQVTAIDANYLKKWPLIPRNLSEWSLVLFNLIPFAGAFFFEWATFDIVFAYWLEGMVIALFAFIKYFVVAAHHDGSAHRDRPRSIKHPALKWSKTIVGGFFFLIHFSLFMVIHLFVIIALLGPESLGQGIAYSEIRILLHDVFLRTWPFIVMLFLSHAISFFSNFIGRKEFNRKLPRSFIMPYGRIMIMHLSIFVMVFIILPFHIKALAVIPIILTKIFTDLIAHRKEHAKIAAAAE